MANILNKRVAVITGSGQGIGRAIAIAMAREGARVITNSRSPGTPGGDAATTAREIDDLGGQARAVFCDVSKYEQAQHLVQNAVSHFGRIDILVNNAIVYVNLPIWEMTEGDWDKCLDTGLKGVFNCTRHASTFMKDQEWGRIVSVTSVSALGSYAFSAYGAAKAGIVGLTRCLATDLGKYGVTCNAFAPSASTRWSARSLAMEERWRERYEAGSMTREQYLAKINVASPSPETVPPLVVYLCSEQAADINGQVFRINGGRIAVFSEPAERNPIEKKDSIWSVEELSSLVPGVVLKGYKNRNPSRVTGTRGKDTSR